MTFLGNGSSTSNTPTQTSFFLRHRQFLFLLVIAYILASVILTLAAYRILLVLNRTKPTRRGAASHGSTSRRRRGHLLIVLGSGGHTSEMLSILENLGPDYLNSRFERRTWVVSSGDAFSASRARMFEETLVSTRSAPGAPKEVEEEGVQADIRWHIATVVRARKVHQSLYTTPFSALLSLRECIQVLRGTHRDLKSGNQNESENARAATGQTTSYPDLILTNGPGTGVIVILASLLLMFIGLAPVSPPLAQGGAMRSIYIESWARVKTLSLSGKILRFMVGRFLVQWRTLADTDLSVITHEADVQDASVNLVDREQEKTPASLSLSLPRSREYIGPVVT